MAIVTIRVIKSDAKTTSYEVDVNGACVASFIQQYKHIETATTPNYRLVGTSSKAVSKSVSNRLHSAVARSTSYDAVVAVFNKHLA